MMVWPLPNVVLFTQQYHPPYYSREIQTQSYPHECQQVQSILLIWWPNQKTNTRQVGGTIKNEETKEGAVEGHVIEEQGMQEVEEEVVNR
jgi:hypothetical protein